MRSPDSRSKVSSKQITKTCRKCHKQLPTACKMCSCGFHFRKSSPPTTLEDEQNAIKEEVQPTRLRRTRSRRPQFFDSLDYGNCIRKKSRLSSSSVAGKVTKKSDLMDSTNKKLSKDAMEVSSISSASAVSHSSESFASTPPASSSSSSSSSAAVPDNRLRTAPSLNGRILRDNSTTDQPLLLSIILAEINRKYMSVSFRPA